MTTKAPSLPTGLEYAFSFTVPEGKTVPHLFPEAPELQEMPRVLATGFLVGLCEWACIQAINPHIDWPTAQTVGTRIDISHLAPTPPGLTVTVELKLLEQAGRRLKFALRAHDGIDLIAEGTHERMLVDAARFGERLKEKMT